MVGEGDEQVDSDSIDSTLCKAFLLLFYDGPDVVLAV